MTVRIPDANANGFNFGESPIPSADVNDTHDAMIVRHNHYDDDTESQTDAATFQDASSFTITGANGGILMGFSLTLEMKTDSGGRTEVAIKISGTNTGTHYIVAARQYYDGGDANLQTSQGASISASESYIFSENATGYAKHAISPMTPIPLKDDTVTITIRFLNATGAHTAFVDSVDMDVLYTEIGVSTIVP